LLLGLRYSLDCPSTLGLTNETRHHRSEMGVGGNILRKLDGQDFDGIEVLIEELDEAAKRGRDGISYEDAANSTCLQV